MLQNRGLNPPGRCGLIPVFEATLSRRPGASSILQFERVETAMNYFPFHLGDYATHTAHLEPLEDLAYRRMLDLYYLHEVPLPAAVVDVAKLVRMKNNLVEVGAVLAEFFILSDGGWSHERCDREIAKMQDKQAKAKASAQASVNARQASAQRTLNERSTDAELPTPTPTPTPITNTSLREGTRLSAGEVCKAMKGQGLQSVSPAHPKLIALIDAGITLPEFTEAAKHAFDNQKPFAYALATAEGRRRDSATLPLPNAGLNKQELLEASNAAVVQRFLAKDKNVTI